MAPLGGTVPRPKPMNMNRVSYNCINPHIVVVLVVLVVVVVVVVAILGQTMGSKQIASGG